MMMHTSVMKYTARITHTPLTWKEAKGKVESSGIPPARVAFETGFADQSHLTRQFKRFTGVTPGHFSSL